MSYKLQVKSLKARVEILKAQVETQKYEFQIHELSVPIYELRVQIHEFRVQIHQLRVRIHELQVRIHVSLNQWKLRYDNLLFYDSTTPWLRLQQEAERVNIDYERRDLNFARKNHPPPNDFEEICFLLCF